MIKKFVENNEKRVNRFLEILPGFVSWSLILFPFWGSFVIPTAVAYYILAFDVYWFYRSISIALCALLAHFKLKAYQNFDWLGEIKSFPGWEKVLHITIIPTYKEPDYILRRTLSKLTKQSFPNKRIAVVLAFEKREGKDAFEKAEQLKKEFKDKFGYFITTFHPDLPGEVKGKSSNTSWAAKIAKKKIVDEDGWNIDYITITSEDADAILHKDYFSCLTFKFLDDPDRYRRIFQPAILFYNNIWEVPILTRVFNANSSVFQLGLLYRKDRLINFSTYSSSLKMIDKIGYWDTDVIPEDYRLFFKSFFKLEGELEVHPIYLPVYEDAAQSTTLWKTLVNQYEQVKRWAWGTADDAYIIKNWLTVPNLPFWKKTVKVLRVIEDHFLWPVYWFAITIGASLPPLLNQEFNQTVLGKTLPQVSSTILTFSLLSMLFIVFVDLKQRPKKKEIPLWRWIVTPIELILLPVAGFFFSALPGLDAHTRLMLGKYIEYRVTEKV